MKRILFSSLHPDSGKTALLLGYARSRAGAAGYVKPFGDRPYYKKKRLWDSDASLMTRALGLEENPDIITLGFDHSKVRYTYPGDTLTVRLREAAEKAEDGHGELLIEGGATLASGASIGLDAVTMARALEAKLYVILAGDPDTVADGAYDLARRPFVEESFFGGLIINRISEPDEFRRHHLPVVEAAGLTIAGLVPRDESACALTTAYLADELFVKVLAGEPATEPAVDSVVLGVMSATAAREDSDFRSRRKLLVTDGSRSDLIVAALESGAAGVLLAADVPPEARVTALAREKNIPLLLSSASLLDLVRRVKALKPLPSYRDPERLDRLGKLAAEYLTI